MSKNCYPDILFQILRKVFSDFRYVKLENTFLLKQIQLFNSLKKALVNKNVFGELKKALVNYSGF